MSAGWLPDTVTADDTPLLEVEDCDPLNGGVLDSFVPRTDVAPSLW